MDCKRPSYLADVRNDPSESLHYCTSLFSLWKQELSLIGNWWCSDQEWKHSCYIHCLSPVLEIISSPVIDYATVIDLDRKIRDFSTPRPLQSGITQSRPLIMQKASLSTALEAGKSVSFRSLKLALTFFGCSPSSASSYFLHPSAERARRGV